MVSGAVTVYVAEGAGRLRWRDYLLAPMMTITFFAIVVFLGILAVFLFKCAGLVPAMLGVPQGGAACVAGTVTLSAMAVIFAAIGLPLLFAAGAGDGLMMGLFCRLIKRG